MREDEIVKETRRLRDEYAKQFNYNLDLIFEDLLKKQKESGRKYVSFSDKKNKKQEIEEGLPTGTLLNVNVPKGEIKGVRITKQGFKDARPIISEHIDPRGKLYYWIGEERTGFHAEGGTDFEAVDEGYVSVTQMRSDLTNHKAIELLQAWNQTSV